MTKTEGPIRLDLNNPVFQEQLLTLQKADRHAALDTLNKIRQLSWNQLYRDPGIKWEKITSIKPPAHREGEYTRLLTIAPDHDSTYGRGACSVRWLLWAAQQRSHQLQHLLHHRNRSLGNQLSLSAAPARPLRTQRQASPRCDLAAGEIRGNGGLNLR